MAKSIYPFDLLVAVLSDDGKTTEYYQVPAEVVTDPKHKVTPEPDPWQTLVDADVRIGHHPHKAPRAAGTFLVNVASFQKARRP
jgi:hypothetical protein